ncbi:PREDICTED: sortilin-related receptor-like [Papilio polytes]|uniref:sortilin-related receptor-like n=1 Tax=Papilio polytes TaxID=76194 RepID=UPI0006769705|nr:PREDICTED: sortilin-related receptor-like [Papilio polytes]
MFTVIRRRICLIALLYFIPCVLSLHEYETWEKSLYVAQEPLEGSGKLFVINKFDTVGDGSRFERKKREAPTTPAPALEKNISTWTTHLNDSHQQLMVHWVGEGSKVIICLARDSSPRSNGTLSPSALFISYNYGQTIVNKTESFRLDDTPNSGYAQLDRFYNHPKHPEFCVFVDSTNKRLYYTDDNGHNILRSELTFHPSELLFDEDNPKRFVVLDKVGRNRMLYMTFNGGKTFTLIQSYVKTFYWSSGPGFPKMFYLERWEPNRSSTVLSVSDPEDMINAKVLFADAKEFQIKGDYMFAMRQKDNNTLDLYISHQRGPFYKAEFQTELDRRKFHIADVTDKRIFISVMHTENLTNLYVSEISNNFTQYNFVLSLEQVLCYFPQGNWKDSWLEDVTDDAFTDLYRVEGLKGIYIASKVNSKSLIADIEPEHLVSLITFDHGVTWSLIKPPAEDENGKPISCSDSNQTEKSCSLHLCQKFSQLYPVTSPPGNVISNAMRSASIMSSKSAPGIIMATGVVGRSLKGIPGVYLSRDAGLTWKRILKDFYFFNYGDHGGVLVAVKYFKMLSETREILYSTNEGIEWNSYQFNANDLRIYGLMTEPGENTTVFTMFGSANEQHQWIIITIDLQKAFPRNCTADDYKDWSPSPPNTAASCVLGTRDVFQRRLAHTNCYNGIDYDGPIRKEVCECGRRDFECDFGFVLSRNVCEHNKTSKYDPYSIPPGCRPGEYYLRTKGYRKIDGDVCTTSGYLPYNPDEIPCPLDEPTEFLLVALRDKIARIDLSDNTTIFPIKDQQNIVAIEFDMKNNCIYWADIEVDKISRQCFETGFVQEVVVDTDLASIEGMALDWISNVLFFVDGMRKKIEAVRTDLSSEGRMRVTILGPDVLSKPRGIVVHPKAGYLFWTDWDRNNPSVSRSNLDGSHIVRLFEKPIVQWPNGITIDQMSERIYWVDAMEDYIASADLNGQYFKKILVNDEKVSHPFAVAVLKDKMYWDDWKAKSIFIADKDNGQNVITINGSFSGLMGLKVFAHFIQHGSNACSYKNTSCDALCLGGPANSFSCLCPDGFVKSHGKCLCPNLVEPYANLTCPKKPGATCAADQFSCKNDMCIAQSWRCDGNDDCGDGSDEAGCVCAPPRVACDNGSCYLPQWRCDGDIDCSDMTDEKDCGKHNCSENEFQCGNGNCVDKRWVCDGDNDCKDDSDERNCTSQVKRPSTQVNCSVHILTAKICDGVPDCADHSDETHCTMKASKPSGACPGDQFECDEGTRCVWRGALCDARQDCYDGSDETNCSSHDHNYHYVSLGVDQSSINSTSFLVSCWLAQQQRVMYSFLPSIANVSDGIWRNMTWTTDSVYRFTGLEPYTNYNVTFYIRDSKSNNTYPAMKYVNTTTGEGVPSPPLRVSVRQMIGSRVNVIWDPPARPRGQLRRYTLHYAPPLPPAHKVLFVTHHEPVSLTVRGYFKPNTNYSFWVTATNNAYTSNSSEVMYLTFDEMGDVDDLKNITVTRLANNTVFVRWDKIRSVDGYIVSIQLPLLYSHLEPVQTKDNNVTLKNLPPGVKIFIHVMAYKGSMIGEPVTEVVVTEGERDEMLNMTAILLKEKRTAVLLSWSPPLADRYKDKELQYEVIYTDAAHWRIPTDLKEGHEKKIITKNTSIVIDGLHACETYVFTVSLLGGPVAKYKEIVTRENPKAPIKDLDYEYIKEKSELKIKWHINCNALSEAVPYRLEITELTHNKVSRYALNATRNSTLQHVIEHVPVGGRFNICVAAHVEDASKRCIEVRTGALPAPRGLVAWLAPNGHLVLNWQHVEGPDTPKHKYQIIVSEKEIPEDLVQPEAGMRVEEAERSPLLLAVAAAAQRPLYVSVRAVTHDGYYSELSEVNTLTMEGTT